MQSVMANIKQSRKASFLRVYDAHSEAVGGIVIQSDDVQAVISSEYR